MGKSNHEIHAVSFADMETLDAVKISLERIKNLSAILWDSTTETALTVRHFEPLAYLMEQLANETLDAVTELHRKFSAPQDDEHPAPDTKLAHIA